MIKINGLNEPRFNLRYQNNNNNNNNVYFKSLSYTNVLFKLEMKAQTK